MTRPLSLYLHLPDDLASEADRRVKAIKTVDRYCCQGRTKTVAVAFAAREAGVSMSTVWRWMSEIGGRDWCDVHNAAAPHHAPSIRRLVYNCLEALPPRQCRRMILEVIFCRLDREQRLAALSEIVEVAPEVFEDFLARRVQLPDRAAAGRDDEPKAAGELYDEGQRR